MPTNKRIQWWVRDTQRGATLVIVALSLVILLGISALAIDLVSLYVVRSEAQRAADAAALAGAEVFVKSGCTSATGGCVAGGPQEAIATQRAIDVGSRNPVGGKAATILSGDVTFSYPKPQNPTITVNVARDATHGGPMPTFFIKIFGVTSANISTSATAEAFNPSGSNIPVGTACLKPWLMPNCDFSRLLASSDPNANPNCPDPSGKFASYFIKNNSIVNPGAIPSGVIGMLFTVKPGRPSQAATSSKFYPINLPPDPTGTTRWQCPSLSTSWCQGPGGGGSGGGTPSGDVYASNVECCNETTVTCGQNTVTPITGDKTGPTALAVDCLIHQQGTSGQDTILFSGTSYSITAGSNNPFFPNGSRNISPSDSVITVPLYDGQTLCPGGSCPATINVNVVGFMQIFVKEETNPQGTVNAYIMNVAACGTSSGGGTPVINTGGGSPIPVRLIHK